MQSQSAPVLVTGGTGTLGQLVVAQLRDTGRAVRVLTRTNRENTEGLEFVTGDLGGDQRAADVKIASALDGVATVVHCAGSTKGDEDKARILVRAASAAGVSHLIYISVVGADRIPLRSRMDRAMFGYFGAKLAAERIVADSGIPFTTLRATQFHDLILQMAQQMSKLPVLPAVAGFRFQPVDAGEVAARLVELALGQPAGLVPELGGPQVSSMADLLRSYLRAGGRRRPVVAFPLPGAAARAFRAGANLTVTPGGSGRSWEEFLAERIGAHADAATG